MSLPAGASFAYGELKRIEEALEALAKDIHAPRSLSVGVNLHVHHEFPKHVKVGEDKDGNAITKIVNNADEEVALVGGE